MGLIYFLGAVTFLICGAGFGFIVWDHFDEKRNA